MPPFRTLKQAQPDPFAGQNVKAFQLIIQTMAKIETMRQNQMIESSVLTALSRGTSAEELAQIAGQPVQFDEGIPGFFQKIAAKYAGPSPMKTAITEGLAKEAISPDKVTMSDIRMREYLKAVQAGDKERADKLLMSSLVSFDFGKKPWWMEGAGEEDKTKYRKGQIEPTEEAPLSVPQLKGYGEQMNTRLDKSKVGVLDRLGEINYPESELFKQWQIFASMHKFKNDTQKEQIWNVWQNKIKNRAAEGWFGKETDFDPTDPKWREAIGLKAAKGKATEDMMLLSDEELKRIAEGE